tara:strand:- start:1718 stop:1984 length:267 start_codon:yes stop_codon:yes gene_type:complete
MFNTPTFKKAKGLLMKEAKSYVTKKQKVRVSFAVEVDANMLKEYIKELGTGETVSQFVKSHMIASAVGVLEENLLNNGYGYNTVEIIK